MGTRSEEPDHCKVRIVGWCSLTCVTLRCGPERHSKEGPTSLATASRDASASVGAAERQGAVWRIDRLRLPSRQANHSSPTRHGPGLE